MRRNFELELWTCQVGCVLITFRPGEITVHRLQKGESSAGMRASYHQIALLSPCKVNISESECKGNKKIPICTREEVDQFLNSPIAEASDVHDCP